MVPSLADDANKQPYALLRSVAPRLHMAINGRVAVYSGAPDQGAANRDSKDAVIQNLARWAANGHTHTAGLVGLVAFLDLSEKTTDRYSWVRSISLVDVSADEELQAFGDITPMTSRGGDMFTAAGKPVRFSNMASYGLHIGAHGAARTEVSASGGGASRQSVLVQYSNADGASESVSGGSTGQSWIEWGVVQFVGNGCEDVCVDERNDVGADDCDGQAGLSAWRHRDVYRLWVGRGRYASRSRSTRIRIGRRRIGRLLPS